MKRLFIFLSVFIVSLSVARETYSWDCPPDHYQVVDNFTIGDCDYTVYLCIWCPSSSPNNPKIELKSFQYSCLNNDVPLDVAYQNVMNEITKSTYVSSLCTFPPCPDARTYDFSWTICWVKKYFGPSDIRYEACMDYQPIPYCLESYSYCYDSGTGQNIRTPVYGPELVGTVLCSTPWYSVPDPTEQDPVSDCFYILTPCYPY